MTADLVGDRYALPPELERARVLALHRLHVLHTPPEERFARITKLARLVFDVPMAAVSLVDADHQWFKQVDGLDIGAGVPRGQTVCRAVITRGYTHPEEPELILSDLAAEPEFADLPGVVAAGLRFYAGVPLLGPDRHVVGSFCIYDTVPHTLDERQRDVLRELACWAQRELQQSDEMERAAQVQQQLLPPPIGDLPGYAMREMCLPALAVGGDFFDHYAVSGGLIVTVADVMGKGLGAALINANVRAALRAATRALDHADARVDLASAVTAAAEQLAEDLDTTQTFVTLFHARLDLATGIVTYVDAGHGVDLIVRSDGSVEALPGGELPMGVPAGDGWRTHSVTLGDGDMLVIGSDGVLDLVGDGTSVRPAVEFVAAHPTPDELYEGVRRLVDEHPTLDDVTVVAIRREPPP